MEESLLRGVFEPHWLEQNGFTLPTEPQNIKFSGVATASNTDSVVSNSTSAKSQKTQHDDDQTYSQHREIGITRSSFEENFTPTREAGRNTHSLRVVSRVLVAVLGQTTLAHGGLHRFLFFHQVPQKPNRSVNAFLMVTELADISKTLDDTPCESV